MQFTRSGDCIRIELDPEPFGNRQHSWAVSCGYRLVLSHCNRSPNGAKKRHFQTLVHVALLCISGFPVCPIIFAVHLRWLGTGRACTAPALPSPRPPRRVAHPPGSVRPRRPKPHPICPMPQGRNGTGPGPVPGPPTHSPSPRPRAIGCGVQQGEGAQRLGPCPGDKNANSATGTEDLWPSPFHRGNTPGTRAVVRQKAEAGGGGGGRRRRRDGDGTTGGSEGP